ncbi:hypothetical protein HQ447_08140 [bacterium]|nr:hypothetical protein [bacterium]
MLYEKLFFGNFVGTPSSVVVPKTVVESAGLRFDTTLRTSEDWDFFLGIAREHPIYCVPEVLTKYRHRQGSLTKNVAVANDCDNRLLHKHLDRGRRDVSKEHPARVELYLQKTSSYRYREAAYAALFEKGSGQEYRRELANAAKCYSRAVTPSSAVYYLVSFLSVGACHTLKNGLRRETANRATGAPTVVSVEDRNYRHMGIAINQM